MICSVCKKDRAVVEQKWDACPNCVFNAQCIAIGTLADNHRREIEELIRIELRKARES